MTAATAMSDAVHARLERLLGYLEADPANPRLLADVFDACLAAGRREDARSTLERALRRHPGSAEFLYRSATLAIVERRLDDARSVLLELQAERPADAAIRFNLAYVEVLRGNFAEAISILGAVPDDEALPEAQALLVHSLHHQGDLQAAKDAARRALAVNGEDAQLLAVTSLVLWDAGEIDDAARLAAMALGKDPEALAALVTQGSIALGRRDAAQARRAFQAALATNESDGRAWSGLGLASLMEQRFDRAREELETAVRHMPGHIGTWHALAWCAIVRRDLPHARECFERALAIDRNFAETHGGLAVVAALTGDAQAREIARRALALDPKCVSAGYALALLDGEVRDVESFRRLAGRLLAGQGELVETLARLRPGTK